MVDENRKTLIHFIEAVWNQGDIDAVDSFLADGYTIHHDPGNLWGHQTLSIDGFKERVRKSREPIPDQIFDIQSLMSNGHQVFITWFGEEHIQEKYQVPKLPGRISECPALLCITLSIEQ